MPLMDAGASLDEAAVTQLLVGLAVLLGAAWMLGEASRRFGQPAILGEILAGVLLGQTVLGTVSPETFQWLYPHTTTAVGAVASSSSPPPHVDAAHEIHADRPVVSVHPAFIAMRGLVLLSACFLLLVAGLEVDLSSVWRQGGPMLQVAALSMMPPLVIGVTVAGLWPERFDITAHTATLPFALYVGIALSITALPVIAKILIDLNILKTDLGMLIMSAAMVVDVLGWVGFAIVKAIMTGGGVGEATGLILLTGVFVLALLTVVRMICGRIVPYLQARWAWPGGVIGFVLILALACAGVTEWIGIHSIFGAFLAGVAIGDSQDLRERTRETISQFVTSIFAPVFFASIALNVNFVANFDPIIVAVMLTIALGGKICGTYWGGRLAGLSAHESWAVGFGMVAQGSMGVILGELAFEAGLIGPSMFVAMIITAIITSLLSGPAIRFILQPARQRAFGDYLTERRYVASLESTNRRDAISELSIVAARTANLKEDEVIDAVWRREQIMNTSLGHGLAVPHARLPSVTEPIVVVGRSQTGVDFDAPDGQPAHLICLLLTSSKDSGMQLDMLRLFAETFHDSGQLAKGMGAESFNQFLAAAKLPN